MKKYIIILLTLPLIASSCLKDDDDLFSKSSSERMQEFLNSTAKVLADAPNGWVVEYYPSEKQEYGGVRMYMKFDTHGNVTVASEAGDPDKTEKSLFSFGEDFGPTLNFDTYNSLLHYYSEPYGAVGESNIGWGGDYEFIIMSVDKDKVVLRGKKSKNTILLTPASTGDWTSEFTAYKQKVEKMDEMPSYQMVVGGKTYLMSRDVVNSYDSRHFTINSTPAVASGFIYTEKGIKFYEPITVNGVTISEMTWQDKKYVDEVSGAEIVTLKANHTFTVKTSDVKAKTVKVSVTPDNPDAYYVVGAFKASEVQTKNEDQLLKELMSRIFSVSDLYKGNAAPTVKVKRAETEYIACAFAVEVINEYVYPSTGLFKSEPFTTTKDVAIKDNYKGWLGSWTLTSTSSELNAKPVTLNIVIDEDTRNSTYEVYGWDISVYRNTYPQKARLSGNNLTITNSKIELGRYQDYMITWCALSQITGTEDDGIFIVGGAYNPFTCSLSSDGRSATVTPYTGDLEGGGKFVVTSMTLFKVRDDNYYYADAAPGYTRTDFPIGPYTMVKTGDDVPEMAAMAKEGFDYPTYVVDLKAYDQVKANRFRVK